MHIAPVRAGTVWSPPRRALPSPPMFVVETPRLLLRHLSLDDLDALAPMYADPDIRRGYPDGTRTREQTAAEIAWFEHGHPQHPELGLWATIDRASGTVIGRCGLLPWVLDGRFEVEVAYLLGKPWWGRGLATEAAKGIVQHAQQSLGLERLVCLVMPGNEPSVRVAQRIGMRFERHFVDEHGPADLYAMALGPGPT